VARQRRIPPGGSKCVYNPRNKVYYLVQCDKDGRCKIVRKCTDADIKRYGVVEWGFAENRRMLRGNFA